MKSCMVIGTELKVGDYVKVWWGRRCERILNLRPHPMYEKQFGIPGAMIGNFGGTEMTIEPHMMYTVYSDIY